MIYFFVVIQSILLLFMALHDWIDFPPFTNLPALKKAHSLKFRLIGSALNAGLVLIPLILTFIYLTSSLPLWARLLFVSIYGLITFGTMILQPFFRQQELEGHFPTILFQTLEAINTLGLNDFFSCFSHKNSFKEI